MLHILADMIYLIDYILKFTFFIQEGFSSLIDKSVILYIIIDKKAHYIEINNII